MAIEHLSPFVICFAIISYVAYRLKRRCTLPGPWGLPIVGYFPFLTNEPYKKLRELGKTYGDVFQVAMGKITVVVLNSQEAMHEALGQGFVFNDRPDSISMTTMAETGPSRLAFRSGTAPKYLRKCAIKSLSLFASSRSSRLEDVVRHGMDYMFERFDSHRGKLFDPTPDINKSVAGITGAILFGFEFDPENTFVDILLDGNKLFNDFFAFGGMADGIPLAKHIFQGKIAVFKKQMLLFAHHITDYMGSLHYGGKEDNVKYVSDAIVKISEDVSDGELRKYGVSRDAIRDICSDLFGAGVNTTVESLSWLLNLTAWRQEVQQKVRDEIDEKIGDRMASLVDKSDLPYTEAVVCESFRVATLVPLSLPHATSEDTTFRGHFIPKGCTVLPNIYSVHMDDKIFPNPNEFRPQRFIIDGQLDVDLANRVIPFSVGKRRCLGENLARQEIFLIYIHLMQRYKIELSPCGGGSAFDCTPGFIRTPGRHNWLVTKRSEFTGNELRDLD